MNLGPIVRLLHHTGLISFMLSGTLRQPPVEKTVPHHVISLYYTHKGANLGLHWED